MTNIIYAIVVTVLMLFIARGVSAFSPELLINGYMDQEKAEELAPSIFKKK